MAQAKNKKKKETNPNKGKHLIEDCGNLGCIKCNPNYVKLTGTTVKLDKYLKK